MHIRKTVSPSIEEGVKSECVRLPPKGSLQDGHAPLTWRSRPGATLERSFERVSSADSLMPPAAYGYVYHIDCQRLTP